MANVKMAKKKLIKKSKLTNMAKKKQIKKSKRSPVSILIINFKILYSSFEELIILYLKLSSLNFNYILVSLFGEIIF